MSQIAADQLGSFVERIENLETEKKDLGDDIKAVYAEAKGAGFDPKIIKSIIKLRAMDANERKEQRSLIDLYADALGLEV